MKPLNRFICYKCDKAFPLTVNGHNNYYLLDGYFVCGECYNKYRY